MEDSRFGRVKNWVKKHKGKLIVGALGVVTVVAGLIIVNKADNKEEPMGLLEEPSYKFDPGRDLEMKFVDPENGEVLGTIGCTESYMNDMLDCESDREGEAE